MRVAVEAILDQPVVLHVGWTLLHFLWQGAAVGVCLMALLALMRACRPNVRYVASCSALLLMALMPLVTLPVVTIPDATRVLPGSALGEAEPFGALSQQGSPANPQEAISLADSTLAPSPAGYPVDATPFTTLPPAGSWSGRLLTWLTPALPWLVLVWLVGVFALSTRLLAGTVQATCLKRWDTSPVPERWLQVLRRLGGRLGVARRVQMLQSRLAREPLVLGWLRPVILLPASVLTGLHPVELEAIIAHELAHIRRWDYLVNLLQTVVETLLFYHPAVWWVSHRIRVEREHCCDDLAVRACGDRLTYIRALGNLEELRGDYPRLAVAAGGGSLLSRVRRLAFAGSRRFERPSRQFEGVAALAMLILLGLLAQATGLIHQAAVQADEGSAWEAVPDLQDITNLSTAMTYETIQAAIDNAVDGDEIVLPVGRYGGDGNRDLDLKGKAITVRSVDPGDPAVVAATVIDCEGSEEDRHRGFRFFSGEGPQSVVAGLTITRGYAPLEQVGDASYSVGGGMACGPESTPTVINCRIMGNIARGEHALGGGIYGSPTLRGCVISGNMVEDRNFSRGGGIYCHWGSTPTFTNCVFTGNLGAFGGGIKSGRATLVNCMIVGNPAHINGGGVHSQDAPLLINCLIGGNTAGGSGGAFFGARSGARLVNCTVVDNLAANSGGAAYCKDFSDVALVNSIVWGNWDAQGTQLVVTCDWPNEPQPSQLAVRYSTIEGGSAAAFVKDGSTLAWGEGSIAVPPGFGEPLEGQWSQPAAYKPDTQTITLIDDSARWAEGTLVGRSVNLDVNQRLHWVIAANTARSLTVYADWRTIGDGKAWLSDGGYRIHDYRCMPASPCRDAGDNGAVPQDLSDLDGDGDTVEFLPLDLRGSPRFADDAGAPDTGNPGGTGLPLVSLGAFE